MRRSEADAIAASSQPATTASLVGDLEALGLPHGEVVIVHSSLSALGWVVGGAQAVIDALFTVVGSAGTIVMPAQSGQLSDPAGWSNPPVPPDWVDMVRAHLPAFDPYVTPTRGMGQVVECFRQHRSTIRSTHPTVSFAANGPAAEAIIAEHPLTPALGDTSPLGRLYERDAWVLLLGVTHANNTSLHLAEHRASWPGKTTRVEGSPIWQHGTRVWATYEDLDLDDNDFDQIGEAFAATGAEHSATVGTAGGRSRLCRQRAMIDFGSEWMTTSRQHPA